MARSRSGAALVIGLYGCNARVMGGISTLPLEQEGCRHRPLLFTPTSDSPQALWCLIRTLALGRDRSVLYQPVEHRRRPSTFILEPSPNNFRYWREYTCAQPFRPSSICSSELSLDVDSRYPPRGPPHPCPRRSTDTRVEHPRCFEAVDPVRFKKARSCGCEEPAFLCFG